MIERRLDAAPLLAPAAAFAAGIAAGAWLAVPASRLLAAGAILLLGAALTARARPRAAGALVLAGVGVLGALRAAGPGVPGDHLARAAPAPTVALEGRVAEEPVRGAPDRVRLLLDVDGLHAGPERRPATGRVQLTVYGEPTAPLGEGQRVRVAARLHRPVGFRNPGGFDYPAHLRRDGILLVGHTRADRITALTPDVPPARVAVKRWAVGVIAARLPEASAALLAGLLLGERSALPPASDEAFRRAGVYHILAVSGFNVALLAGAVFGGLGACGVPRRAAAAVAASTLVGFALVVGAQPSVLRATAMGLLLLAAVLLDRESQLSNALALAGLALLLWRPGDLWDPGFQLSFAATAGIVHLAPRITAVLTARGAPRWLATALAVSVAAQAAVTPLMLAHFNQLSLIGVAANLVVVPLAAVATALGMLALLVELGSEALAALLFAALWLVLVALRATVAAAAALPSAMVHLPAPAGAAVAAWYAALLLAPDLPGSRRIRAAVAVLAVTVASLSIWPWLRPTESMLRVTFLDVGQGDATLIEFPEGPRLLVDGGPAGPRRFDVGERVLAPFLWNRPLAGLDAVALSHWDVDHAGGLAAVLTRFHVGEFWESGHPPAGAPDTVRALARSRAPRRALTAGHRLWLGRALVTVLGPAPGPPQAPNDQSLVLRLDWRGVSLLLAGDLGPRGEALLLERAGPLRALVLKVAHHGSRFSSTTGFLEQVRPHVAVISAGARNPFRHPSAEALERLEAAGARVYRTDRDGAVILETDGRVLRVTAWARGVTDSWDLDPDASAGNSPAPE
ncbi:MAG TPA: DNA internalization-related competence protein ComEC/Rec2 [Methylomirabilota bacterium]|nr:DNA internalization-related competence protein ComEC/Rec2 [Methylomirabilota bacterium]